MPRLLNLYTTVIIALGCGVLAMVAVGGSTEIPLDETAFWIFTVAVVFGEFAPIRVPGHSTELAISTTFIFALMLSYGPETAILVQAAASILADIRNGKPSRRSVFNVAQYTLAWAAAGVVVSAMVDLDGPAHTAFGAHALPALGLAAAVFFVVNSVLVRTAVAMASEIRLIEHLIRDLPFRAWTTGMLMALAPAICAVQEIDLVLALLIVLPVGAIHRAALESARNEYLATHDSLTGMPNRVLFQQTVMQAIAGARRDGSPLAVMLMDLDRFKEINDTLGHQEGDALLKEIRPRLEDVLSGGGFAARLGGDEFAILVSPASNHPEVARAEAMRIRGLFNDGFEVDGVMLDVGASIGVSLYPEHGDDVDELMKTADVAMYRAKDAGSGVEIYEPEDDHHNLRQLAMARELRLAMEREELILHYQPKLDLATGQVQEVEALVRWEHPERGLVPPGEFIPLAEHAGLILQLTSFVLNQALDQVGRWQEAGINLTVAINLSPRSLLDGNFPEDVAEQLETRGLSPDCLMLEITETAIMTDPVRAARILDRLSAMGIRLAVDDFGTGYSSLSYLKRLPIHEVKIDRSFVMNMARDPDDALIVRSTVELAHGLGRRAVAEGVEDDIALNRLRGFGCDAAQGYHISRPLPADQLSLWLQGPAFVATTAATPRPVSVGDTRLSA